MDGILTPVSISYRNPRPREEDALIESLETPQPLLKAIQEPPSLPSGPEEALKIFKAKPDFEVLSLTLRYLLGKQSNFDIRSPSPIAAQLVHVLVSDVVPNYWTILRGQQDLGRLKKQKRKSSGRESELELVLSCLRSVTGLNAVLLRQKELIRLSKETKKVIGGPSISENLKILLQVLAELLKGDDTIEEIWKTISKTSNTPGKQKVLWQEALALIGSGKILGLSAEAEDIINESSKGLGQKFWVADGVSYSNWLGRNITYWAKSIPTDSESELKACGEILGKAFRLGYTETILKEILTSLLLQSEDYSTQFSKLVDSLPGFEQRNVLYAIFKLVSKEYLSAIVTSVDDSRWWQSDASVVSAAAALITKIIASEETRKNQLIMWLTSSSRAGVGDGIAIRRAAIVVVSRDKSDLETVLEKTLHQFGDQLYIRHTPILQQEAHAQVLLLAAGYVHRKSPLQLSMLMRSGVHLSAISNRLAASSPRARFLGMIVGEALSNLVDKADKRMDFKMEELATQEAKWYKNLVMVQDTVGSLDPLKPGTVSKVPKKRKEASKPRPPPPKPTVVRGTSKIVAIEEIDDEDEDEDEEGESDEDGLIPYAKPDSDAEDSDEDPTLITRNKPTAPVYTRDLINYFRDKESYDKQKLALATAPSLIRRKANFGMEVSSHAEELATLLVGLEDKYEIEDFADMRLQGMIAILISQPQKMGQWFSKTFFDGDYSLSQRASILTTLGLGARELGGFSTEESTSTSKKLLSSFPSKSLPSKTHALYATPSSETPKLESLSTDLTRTMITPLATTLADKLSGPDILKVRTFSSRLSVEANRKRPTTNALAKVVSESFFFPLTGRFFMHLKAYGSSRSNVVFQPHLLSLFIKTLALLLHFSGPSTLSLPQMTSEFWDLLLGLRTQAIGDIVVIEAMLFAFLTMFEINEDKRRLVQEHGRQLLETQEWVEGIFGRVGAGAGEEDQKVRMLAASVLVRIGESVEKYQALLMGDMASFRG